MYNFFEREFRHSTLGRSFIEFLNIMYTYTHAL